MTFPFIEATGNHKEIGKTIGSKMGKAIRQKIIARQNKVPQYKKYLKQIKPYLEIVQKSFPLIIEELYWIAKKAEVPFEDYFLSNVREIYDPFDYEHCTTVASFNKNGPIIGHNEDSSKESVDEFYILKATIGKTTFLGLNYATEIPGVAASINSYGLVQCIDDLFPKPEIGIPKNFIARAILECKNLREVQDILKKMKMASGFNHFLVQEDTVLDIEVSPKESVIQKLHKKPFVHTNHYILPAVKQLNTNHSLNSASRYKRAKKLLKQNMTLNDIKFLLDDNKNTEFPIYSPKDTIASVIIIPSKKEMYIRKNQPDKGNFKRYNIF